MSTKIYEGLFLVEPAQAAAEWEKVIAHLRDLLTKENARILKESKWAERPLAYPIRGQKRGTYILMYFEAPPASIAKIETACRLSETVLRQMILLPPKNTIDKMLHPTRPPAKQETEPMPKTDKKTQEKQASL